jgi:hypothetical protein
VKPALVLALVLIGALGGPALAHQSSVKNVDLTIDRDRAIVQLTVAPGDVTAPLGLADTAQPTLDQATSAPAAAYIAGWLAIRIPDGTACVAGPARAHADGKFIVVEWEARCGGSGGSSIDQLELDFTGFFQPDQRHEAVVSVHAPGEHDDPTVVRASHPILVVRAGDGASIAAWILYGIDHIWGGADHECFVVALLLVVVLVRTSGGWDTRAPFAAVRATATIVTAFTIAHSLSLIAAALGWIALPSRLVESLIALSIVYTAVENVIRPDVRWRFALTFGFGLVHGLGFASTLEERLPPTHVIVPLLSFNVGVELGQLTIVAVVLPAFWAACRLLGADRYRRYVLVTAAVVLSSVGIKWLIERVFDVSTFTFWGM